MVQAGGRVRKAQEFQVSATIPGRPVQEESGQKGGQAEGTEA